MATHSNIEGSGGSRRFAISRKDGQSDKNGRPYFFEYLRELPTKTPGRLFETRQKEGGGERHYELFAAIDGILTDVQTKEREIDGKTETHLVLWLNDAGDNYEIDCGKTDGRYSMDVLKRLLDPAFQPALKIRLAPFSMEKDGKYNIGLSVINGTDSKLTADREKNNNLANIPQAKSMDWKGKKEWDFTPISNWLLATFQEKVLPRLWQDPFGDVAPEGRFPKNERAAPAKIPLAPMPTREPSPEEVADLPF